MNIKNLLGLIIALGVLIMAMVYDNSDPWKLFQIHAILIVVGGTFACISVAFRLDRAARMVLIFFKGFFRTKVADPAVVIKQLMDLADAYRNNDPDLEGKVEKLPDPFMKECMRALLDQVISEEKLPTMLRSRVETIYHRYREEAKMFAACGKYPPAMGLMGAVLGMINLLGSLGQPGAEAHIGPSMAVAMIATLYGIALANLFIIPIGENLEEIAKSLHRKNLIIVEGVRHISHRENPIALAEELNSFLLPSERVEWKRA